MLPQGSTPVDFAYAVHTDIGHRCIAAKINHELAPLRTPLKNGDQVEVITTTQSKPNPAWLSFVASGRARERHPQLPEKPGARRAAHLGEASAKQAVQALATRSLSVGRRYLAGRICANSPKRLEIQRCADGNRHRQAIADGGLRQPPAGAGWRSAGAKTCAPALVMIRGNEAPPRSSPPAQPDSGATASPA